MITLSGSHYPCLERISMVPKTFEPLRFDCINPVKRYDNVRCRWQTIRRNGMYNGVKLVAFICSSIPVVLLYTWRISMWLNTLFLPSPHLCFIKGLICDLFVARNVPWMSLKTSTQTEQICFYRHYGSWGGEGWDPVKQASAQHPPQPPPPH